MGLARIENISPHTLYTAADVASLFGFADVATVNRLGLTAQRVGGRKRYAGAEIQRVYYQTTGTQPTERQRTRPERRDATARQELGGKA